MWMTLIDANFEITKVQYEQPMYYKISELVSLQFWISQMNDSVFLASHHGNKDKTSKGALNDDIFAGRLEQ